MLVTATVSIASKSFSMSTSLSKTFPLAVLSSLIITVSFIAEGASLIGVTKIVTRAVSQSKLVSHT